MNSERLERDEYARRWFDAANALKPIAVRLSVLSVISAATINFVLVPSPWVLVGWALAALIAITVAIWSAVLYAHTKGSTAIRYTHIWQNSYREPWRFVPRREEAS